MAVEKHENVPFEMSSCWKMFLKLEFSVGNVSYEKNSLHFWQLKIGQNSIFFFFLPLAFWQNFKYFSRQDYLKMQNFKFFSKHCFRIEHLFCRLNVWLLGSHQKSRFVLEPYWKGDGHFKSYPKKHTPKKDKTMSHTQLFRTKRRSTPFTW